MTGGRGGRFAPGLRALAAALLACALAARSPSPTSARQAAPPQFPAAVPARASLAELIARCQRGDSRDAAAEFAKWDTRRVAVEASVPASADNATIATLVVLHTRAAILNGAFSGVKVEPRTEAPHFAAAHRLVGILTERAGANPRLRAFCSSWYILAASLWCGGGQYAAAERTLRAGHGLLGDDPEFLLTVATVDEALMRPYLNPEAAEYADAEPRLRKVLSLRPDLIEARLRLGRVCFLLDRASEARPEFERVLLEAPRGSHPFAAAVAALFLGQLHERADRFEDARKAYEVAIGIQPADQTPHLALGHLLVALGRVDEGWAVVRRMLEGPGGSPTMSPDSYHQYRMGQFWQASQRLAVLEAWIRR